MRCSLYAHKRYQDDTPLEAQRQSHPIPWLLPFPYDRENNNLEREKEGEEGDVRPAQVNTACLVMGWLQSTNRGNRIEDRFQEE